MAMQDRGNQQLPPDKRREDAAKFIQEHTGIPARSIGSQIPVIPPVPQPSSPLTSLGQPPTEDPSISLPAANAVTQIDVLATLDDETIYMLPDNFGMMQDGTADVEAQANEPPAELPEPEPEPALEVEPLPELAPDEIEAPQLIPDQAEPEPVADQEQPELPVSQEPPQDAPVDVLPQTDADVQQDMTWELPASPEPVMVPAVGNDAPIEVASWARHTGPVDQAVVAAGGNAMMAKRTDLSHEEKMKIATEGGGDSPRQTELHASRQARQERQAERQEQRESVREERSQEMESRKPTVSSETPQPMTMDQPSPATTDSPTPAASSVPVAAADVSDDGPGFGFNAVPVDVPVSSPPAGATEQRTETRAPMRDNPNRGDANSHLNRPSMGYQTNDDFRGIDQSMGGLFAAASSARSDTVGSDGKGVSTEANAALDAYDQTIQMIIAALSRLVVMSIDHQSKLGTILDRLDSESSSNEFGEGESMWMG